MKRFLMTSTAIAALLASAPPSRAAEIDLPDYSLTPDGTNLTTTFQNTNINTPNGGTVLPASGTPVVYVVAKFNFGADSDAHLQWQFWVNEASAARLGVEIQDTGLVQFLGTGDSTRTNFNFAQDMAGQTVTLLAKLSYDSNNNVTYGKTGASDDTILNVWVNPDSNDVEGAPNSLSAGDMSTIWNSAGFNWFRQIIQNQSTPGTAGTSSITNTTILTGADATFAKALGLATGATPGVVSATISTVAASPAAVPADGTTASTITVTLKDAFGDPIPDKDVTLAASPGNAVINPPAAVTSDANGQAIFTVTSATEGAEIFTATDTTDDLDILQTASVAFVSAADADLSTVVAVPTFVDADGTATSTITVSLKATGNLPVPDKSVTLAQSLGSGATITPATAQTSDASGQVVFIVQSSTPGAAEFTATDETDSVVITQKGIVNFVGAPDAVLSTVGASPAALVANGIATSTITVSLADANGFPAAGREVTLAASNATPTITPESAITDANGVATFVVSSTTTGPEIFMATADSVPIIQTAGVEFLNPSIPFAVNVNFNAFTGGNVPPGLNEVESELAGPAGGLGARWNQVAANSSSGMLLDPAGTGTGVGFTTNFTEGRYDGTGALPMLRSTLTDFAKGTARTFTITGLPSGAVYNVWLTGFRNQPSATERIYARWTANNPTTSPAVQFIDNRDSVNGTTFVEGYNYIVFENVQADENGQISFAGKGMMPEDGAAEPHRISLSGFQIVPAAPALITSFGIPGYPGVIDQVEKTISLEVPASTDFGLLAPVFTLTSGTCNQTSGEPPAPTFAAANPVEYIVTDNSTEPPTVNSYLVTVSISSSTPYQTWAGDEPFDGDKNNDGVDNGLAFLLGADNPDDNALGLLPAASEDAGGLVLVFNMLNAAMRGSAALTLEWSHDLGATDLWESNQAVVPDASGTVNGVVFSITPGDPTNTVQATIPVTEAPDGRLFGRLMGTEN
jgi:hypothetical protein